MRTLVVWGDRDFTIEVPDDAKVTFGPFSPPSATGGWKGAGSGLSRGTLRIYKGTKTTENVIAVFAGVEGFRDTSLPYVEAPPPPGMITTAGPFRWSAMDDDERAELAELIAKQLVNRAADAAMSPVDEEEELKIESLPY